MIYSDSDSETLSKLREKMMKNFPKALQYLSWLLIVGLLSLSTASAGALDQPKAQGLIGEQANGYLGLVTQNAPSDVKALIKEVNTKRKTRYQSIAKQQGISLSKVEKVGGTTAMDKTLTGNYIKSNGAWQKK